MKHSLAFFPASPAALPASAAAVSPAGSSGCSASSCASLEPIVKSSDTGKSKRANRLARFSLKATASRVLFDDDEKLARRISACCYVGHGGAVTLEKITAPDGSVRGAISGTVTCQSVWSCAVCSARISETRRKELNALLSWSRASKMPVAMLTLTARHNRGTALVPFLAALRSALNRLRVSRAWRSLSISGTVSATEITHGGNGWHPHFHILAVGETGGGDLVASLEKLRSEWSKQLIKAGLSGNDAAFQVQSASATGDYIAKWGAGEELALSGNKRGRGVSSRTPFQILEDAQDGCSQSARLFAEYALAFKGKRQLVWSKGLKAAASIDEVLDADCGPEGDRVVLRSWPSSSCYWRSARRRLCSLLDAVELGTSLDVAEFGPTDAALWRRSYIGSAVLE